MSTDDRRAGIKTRATDNTAEAEDFVNQRRAYRRLTIVYATACAGILGLAINGLYYNQGAGNNQENCKLTQIASGEVYDISQRIIDANTDPAAVKRQTITRYRVAEAVAPTKERPLGRAKTCKQQFPKKTFLIF